MTPDEMVEGGQEIMEGKGLCFTCHTIGKKGALRFPDLEGIGARAARGSPGSPTSSTSRSRSTTRAPSSCPASTPACRSSTSRRSGSPTRRSSAVIAYLQSLGGKVTVTMRLEGVAARRGAPPRRAPARRARGARPSPAPRRRPPARARSFLTAAPLVARRGGGVRAPATAPARRARSPGRSPAGSPLRGHPLRAS